MALGADRPMVSTQPALCWRKTPVVRVCAFICPLVLVPLDMVGRQAHLVDVGMEEDLHGDDHCDRLLCRLLQEAVDVPLVVADQA